MAIGVQRYPINARRPGAREGGTRLSANPVRRGGGPGPLARRRRVLVGVGVAARPIQGALTGAGPGRLIVLLPAAGPCHHALVRRPVGGAAGQRTRPPTSSTHSRRCRRAGRPGFGRGAPASTPIGSRADGSADARRTARPPAHRGPHAYQVDLVPDARVGQEMAQVRPLPRALGASRTGNTTSPPGRPVNTTANAPL